MKAELYLPLSYEDKEEDKENIFKNIINDAKYFFEHYDFLNRSQILNTEKIRTTKVVKTDFGFDIELNGIELGSYGIRRNQENKLLWIHGTGLAEPRFSNVVNENLT
jgi:aspartyl-tRNA synthetase